MSLSKHSTTVIYSLFLTVINYIIAYLLSSKEVLFDFKNIGLIFGYHYTNYMARQKQLSAYALSPL